MTTEEKRLVKAARLANIILGAGGLFCALVWVYSIYYYFWTGERYLTSPVGTILYLIFPAVLSSLLFASFRLRPSHKVNLALFFFSTGVSIYALELFLVSLSSEDERSLVFDLLATTREKQVREEVQEMVKVAKKFGVEFDTRTKLEVITDLEKKGINAVPAIPVSTLLKREDGAVKSEITINGAEVLPLGGISRRITVFCNESGEYMIYESDEHGFHNPKGIWDSGRVDIVALGDSFTHGYCVPSDKNFVALIRKHYPATLNLGMAGEGPLMMLAALKEYGEHFKPKIVLWFYFENDLEDLEKEKNSPVLKSYLEETFSQGLRSRQAEIDGALTGYVEAQRDSRLLERPKPIGKRVRAAIGLLELMIKLGTLRARLGLIYGESDSQIDLFRQVLLQAKMYVNTWGGTLYFVYLPARERYAHPPTADFDEEQDEILTVVKTVGVPVIDIRHVFRTQSDPLALFPFRRFAHYNEKGHELVAAEVLRSISQANETAR